MTPARARAWPWREAGLAALLLAVTVDHWTVRVAGLNVKPEHVVILSLLGAAAWAAWRGPGLALPRPLVPFAGFVAVLLIASLVNAPEPAVSLRHTAMVALVVAGAGLTCWLADTPARFRGAVRGLIALGALEAALAGAALLADRLGHPFATQPGLGGLPVPYGSLWEPNFLGSYLAAAGALTLAALLTARDPRRAAGLAGGLALLLAALALSLARAAWGALFVGVLVVFAAGWRYGVFGPCERLRRNSGFALLAGLLALAFLAGPARALFPATARSVFARVDPAYVDVPRDPSLQLRADTFTQGLAGVAAHPFLGNGAGSYGVTHPDPRGGPGWISNLEWHLLYDSGLIGLAAVLGGLAWLAWRVWRALRTPWGAVLGPELVGLLGTLAVLLVAYQATEGTWLGFTWVYVGLLARAGTLTTAAAPAAAIPPGEAEAAADGGEEMVRGGARVQAGASTWPALHPTQRRGRRKSSGRRAGDERKGRVL